MFSITPISHYNYYGMYVIVYIELLVFIYIPTGNILSVYCMHGIFGKQKVDKLLYHKIYTNGEQILSHDALMEHCETKEQVEHLKSLL